MNDYKRLEMIKDRHWTNILKCDILSKYAGLVNSDENIRHEGMHIKLDKEEKYVHNLKMDNKVYRDLVRKSKNQNKDTLLLGIENRNLVEKYKNLQPDGIKSITESDINRFNYKSNKIINKTNIRHRELEDIQKCLLEMDKDIIENAKTKEIMEIRKIDKKLALVHMHNKKTELMVNFAKRNLSIYDTVIEQLRQDVELMGKNVIKTLEIGTFFKEDEATFIQSYINEKTDIDNRINKDMVRINQLNSIIDSLERSR